MINKHTEPHWPLCCLFATFSALSLRTLSVKDKNLGLDAAKDRQNYDLYVGVTRRPRDDENWLWNN